MKLFERIKIRRQFSKRLKILRLKKGWSRRDLANECQTTYSSIYVYELIGSLPNSYSLIKIAKTLKVSTDYLLGLKK